MGSYSFRRKPGRFVPVFLCIGAFLAPPARLAALPSSQNGESSPHARDQTRLPHFRDTAPPGELAASIANAMTDEELLSQILMFGWAGSDPSKEVIDWVSLRSLGSIKVFGWNTDNTEKVASSVGLLQELALKNRFGIPLFVATDQEGGWIRHIKGKTSDTPGNLAIGASGLPSDAWHSGYYIGRELAALGINLNFAPTLDLYTDHDSTVIGPRSFGENPEAAGILGAAFSQGSRKAGVLSTAKHFPGHGHTGLDSHGHLPVIDIDEETLRNRELIPFVYLIRSGVPAIMSAHLSFPRITAGGKPATFSKWFLQDLLRGELGFEGLIITDDIMMNGATTFAGSVSLAVQLAVEAGNDIVESSTTPRFQDAFWVNNLNRMKAVPEFRARVKESATRVLRMKIEYFSDPSSVPPVPDAKKITERVPDPLGKGFFLSQAVRSVTALRTKELPLPPEKAGKVLIASSYPEFLAAGLKRFPGAETAAINADLPRKARKADTVIYGLAGKDGVGRLRELRETGAKIVVVSILSPVPVADAPWAQDVLAIYSYSPFSFQAVFGAIAGDFTPGGRLPLSDLE